MNHDLFPDRGPGRADHASQPVASTTFTRESLEALLAGASTPPSFVDCIFDIADLSRLDLGGCHFTRCSLVETSFFGAQLNGTRWRNCRGRQADFGASDLHDATFRSCDLNNTSWRRAKLASVSFSESKLTGATFEYASTLGLEFSECLLIGADLRGISFRKATLEQLDFSDADLDGADFRDAVFHGGSLRDALLKNARFAGADLRDADLGGLRLTDAAQFRGATISHAQAAMLMEELGLRVA
ncbi:pentapeptide repeat-containing protein [Paraburkholderia sp. GAS42]|jgi:fluoroquinolone resistance protein|uniref:pentapeptide repeat-containing protein n=1 Tax=Paraburkholderia sp. GAS42 TaxID=3035135 RepID=UPI003D1CC293